MSDQPIPQQEVDPVRGLVEALEPFALLANEETSYLPDEHVVSLTYDDTELDDDLGGPNTLLGELFMRAFRVADTALSTYRAWEEGGGSDSAAAPVRSGAEDAPSPAYAQAALQSLLDNGLVTAGPSPSPPASAPPEGWDFLTHLREANETRQRTWCEGGELPSGLFHATELGGEVGEVLNVVKKLEREAMGWRGSRATSDDLAQECADVLICLDKLAAHYGINLAEATAAKFNATSEKVGLPQRLSAAPPPPAGVDRPETEGAPGHTDLMVTPESIDAFMEANPLPEENEDADVTIPGSLFRDMHAAYVSTPFTERMNELIAWAEEQSTLADSCVERSFSWERKSYYQARGDALREVASHLRQLSQGAKTDEG